MPRSKKSTPATKKATKRPAKATKANNMPSVAQMNSVLQSNTTKRDRALIALASVTALGAVGAACGTSQPCKNAVMATAKKISGGMRTAYDAGKTEANRIKRDLPVAFSYMYSP